MSYLDPFKVLMEACCSDESECDDLMEDEAEEEIESEYEDLEELEDDIEYTEEMVNVIQQNTATGSRYIVEMDVLGKYMESNYISDPSIALKKIAEANGLDHADMAILIESNEYVQEMIEEAKKMNKGGSKKKVKQLSATAKLLKDIKAKGIAILKKKKKKNSK